MHPDKWRRLVIRIFWDGQEHLSLEVPLGAFFCNGWGIRCNIASLPVAVNPAGAFNCCYEMRLHKSELR
jgi:D-arabinan exo alpha-(1,3)/(1,5)-arabinofuranosidase (non-reducing end)